MVDDMQRSSDVAEQDFDGDKKPAASVNKIEALMGASLKQKKTLLLRDMSLSRSTAAAAAAM
jgi:hypothetical protein